MEFDDEYTMEDCIGRGSFSSVHSIRDKKSDKQFAAKILQRDSEGYNPEEARIAIGLEHPNIIRTRRVMRRGDEEILVMDLVEGGELFSAVSPRLPLSEAEALGYVRQLVDAVAYLHSQGIVHRDIKLENVLLSERGGLKLIDFGFSKVVGNSRTLKSCCGSPHYIAPEILLASRSAAEGALKTKHGFYGREVDLWAVGVIFYVLLVGQYPFHHERKSQWHKRILEGHFEVPADISLSKETMDLLKGLLHPNPAARLTATEAAESPAFRGISTVAAAAADATPVKLSQRSAAGLAESADEMLFTPPPNRMLSADMSP